MTPRRRPGRPAPAPTAAAPAWRWGGGAPPARARGGPTHFRSPGVAAAPARGPRADRWRRSGPSGVLRVWTQLVAVGRFPTTAGGRQDGVWDFFPQPAERAALARNPRFAGVWGWGL